jgi:hypothetical protein
LARRITYGRYTPVVRRNLIWGLGLLAGLGLAWLLVTGLLAEQQLARLDQRIGEVKTLVAQGRIADAQVAARDVPAMARRAHRLTTGPAWWLSAQVPYLGSPIDVTRGTTAATERIGTDAVPRLLDVAALIDPATLRSSGDTVRIGPLAAAAPALQRAAHAVDRSAAAIDRLPADTWLGAINVRRAAAAAQLDSIRGYVDAAARVASVLPDMLGQHRSLRYFIGLQNEAELRGTGGLPGAFAIAVVHDGTITFTHFESDSVLEPEKTGQQIRTGLDFGGEYNELYGPSSPTTSFLDSNVSPHFPYAAQIWATMWQKVSGERVDGVLALDPTALSYFLAATGPATLPGGDVVDASNVVSLTQRDNYAIFPDNGERKQFLVAVLRATARKVTSGAGRPVDLITATSRSAGEQRLIAWSRDPKIEKVLEQAGYASVIPQTKRPFSGLVLNNAAAGKLDYYLSRTLSYSRTGCGATRDVLVTITLTNNAPASGLPAYVTGRADDNPPADAKPGDNRMLIDYYATDGAQLQSASLNQEPTTAAALTMQGHAVFRMDLELPRGTTQTIVLHLEEPAGHGTPQIWRQPGVTPLQTTIFDQRCG